MTGSIIKLDYRNRIPKGTIKICGSKSESNRLLILQKLVDDISIRNISVAEDTELLQKALSSSETKVDIHHAGTAMRFLTAYFAIQDGKEVVLTGSERMKNRPIKVLVDALNRLGAEISYLEKSGFPPLRIKGKKLSKEHVSIAGNLSSQYISALLLIAPKLQKGLTIEFTTEITSRPYLEMTIHQLQELGVEVFWKNNLLTVNPIFQKNITKKEFIVESDWSSASYFYSLLALSKEGEINLTYFLKDSKQGDAELSSIYDLFGIKTSFLNNHIQLRKKADFTFPSEITLNLNKTPDIAQTIAVTCLGLGIDCFLTGLHTLKIKETDRLQALKNELEKLGAKVEITDDSLKMQSPKTLSEGMTIETYQDHRMAMAFAPLSVNIPLSIANKDEVKKSYPNFWNDLDSVFN